MNSLPDFLLLSAILFGIGIYGLVTKRNALRLLFAVEIMINAANLNFVAFSQYASFFQSSAPANGVGQTFVLFSIALAAAEAAVILAIVVVAFRLHQDVDVSELKSMGG